MELRQKLTDALAMIEQWRLRIAKLEHKKDSKNSSVPPSKDENRKPKNRSLRKKSGKKTGGQPGHKGHKLHMVDNPDHIENHMAQYCQGCGSDLNKVAPIFKQRRQEIDIPPLAPEVTEHRTYTKQCSCGHCNEHQSITKGIGIFQNPAWC